LRPPFARTPEIKGNPVSGVVQDLGTLDGISHRRQKLVCLEIVKAIDRQILAYSSTIPGNGGFTDDWYFIHGSWNSEAS
jgi:hypothetical protein